jgi:hypothetical protein
VAALIGAPDGRSPVMTTPTPVYRSSGQAGFASGVSADPRHVRACKVEHEVDVRFAPKKCTVETIEGKVHAQPGDAIITGAGGERWRVSRNHFDDKYRPKPPTRPGADGIYIALPSEILALRMSGSFDVWLADGISLLHGRAGDWLVDYGDGSLGIVAEAIFATTYDIIG